MGKLQEIYDFCKEKYNDCFAVVNGMACAVSELLAKKGESYDPKNVTLKFDLLLQYSLLQVAVADNDFDRNELIFIRDITNQGDLVDYLNAAFGENFKWEDYFQSDVQNLQQLLALLNDQMIQLSREFVTLFAFCDSMLQKDHTAELEQKVAEIIVGLCTMDNNVTEQEMNTEILFFKVIGAIKAEKEKNA